MDFLSVLLKQTIIGGIFSGGFLSGQHFWQTLVRQKRNNVCGGLFRVYLEQKCTASPRTCGGSPADFWVRGRLWWSLQHVHLSPWENRTWQIARGPPEVRVDQRQIRGGLESTHLIVQLERKKVQKFNLAQLTLVNGIKMEQWRLLHGKWRTCSKNLKCNRKNYLFYFYSEKSPNEN